MASIKGVYYYSAYVFVICLLLLKHIADGEVVDTRCSKLWYISLNKELVLSWTGDDRDAIVTATFTTKDTYGRECDSNKSLKSKFSERSIRINKPCSNALYSVSVAVICGTVIQNQDLTIRTPPDVPTITYVKSTNSSIEVKWFSPPGKIQLYKVTLRGGRKFIETEEQETPSTTWTFKNLLPYTDYQVTVSAKNEDHWGKASPVTTIKTKEGVPFEPENLKATEITSEKIVLKWDKPEPETGVIIRYDISWTEKGSASSSKSSSQTTSYVIENIFPSTFYDIAIAAVNSIGIGPAATLTESTKLAVPPAPDIEVTALTNTSFIVKWKISSVYRGPDPTYILNWTAEGEGDHTANVDKTSKEDQFTIINLKPFTTYEVCIRANNDAGPGSWSKILKPTTLTGIPSTPKDLMVLSKSATEILIAWNDPFPANGVIKGYKVAWGANPEHLTEEHIRVKQFTATDLSPFTNYHFKVGATTEAGWGDWTQLLEVMTDIGVPSEPLNLTESRVTRDSIDIQWLPPEQKNGPHLSYNIRWMKTADDTEDDYYDFEGMKSFKEDDVVLTVYHITNLDPYSNYTIQVCAKSAAGMGNYTAPLIIQTIAGIPSPPIGVKTVNVKSTEMTLEWFAPEFTNGPLQNYVVHWGVTGTKGSSIDTTLTSYRALGLRPYTEYFFKVAAQTEGGQSPYNSIFSRSNISAPSAPRNLLAISVTDHCILLQWSDPENPNAFYVEYTIEWKKFLDESTRQFFKTNSTSYRIRNLASNTNYSIRICSWTKAGEGPWTENLYIITKPKNHSSAVIAGSIVSGLLVLFITICIILLYIYKRKGGLRKKTQSKPTTKSSETLQTTAISLEDLNDSGKIKVGDFDQHVLKLMSHGYYKLAQEFENLGKESPAFPTNEAKKNDNLTKNRWVKILPFDYSRVKLLPVGDEVEPDFINANYIPGDSYLMEYIATQGPLSNTVNDFWRMVWQESVFLIIMLTQCVERAKRTCEKYWPAAGTSQKYGNLDVQTVSENISPTFTQRLFLVTQDKKQRHVVHLNYMNWPVSGCPKSPDDFLAFVQTVRSQMSCGVTGPILVHCSAGIGRTGTYIAVDRMSQQINRQCDEVDVYGTVLEMRKYRANLVQTEEQYYFIHLCLQRIIQDKRQNTEDDYGGGIYSN